jgi:predicted transcriptional regulator/predicted nucleotidyltransferase
LSKASISDDSAHSKQPKRPKVLIKQQIKLSPADRIAGYPAIEIIKFLKKLAQQTLDTEEAASFLKLDLKSTKALLNQLASVENLISPQDSNHWDLTDKGELYAEASLSSRVKRQTASDILNELPAIAESINSDNNLAYRVERLAVFGSYLSDKDRLGDVDIAFDLFPRLSDHSEQFKLMKSRAEVSRKRFSEVLHQLAYSQNEVLLKLKARRKSISLHGYDDIYATGSQVETIYVSPLLVDAANKLTDQYTRIIRPALKGMQRKEVDIKSVITSAAISLKEFSKNHSELKQPGLLRAIGHQMSIPNWEYANTALGFFTVLAATELDPGYMLNEHLIDWVSNQHFKNTSILKTIAKSL